MTTRQVEEISKEIAEGEASPEYLISHARIIQIENDESTPSIYKLYSLSAIYGIRLSDLLGLYLNLTRLSGYQLRMTRGNTRPLTFEEAPNVSLNFPIRFDPGFRPDQTAMISRIVQVWGEIPGVVLQQLRVKQMRYGFIGFEDYMLYPLLRPGSFVQIDDSQRRVVGGFFKHESERPIYFLELRNEYVCSWCELHKDKLIAMPHPLSRCRVREFAYPSEVDVIGRVTAVATRLVDFQKDGVAQAFTAAAKPAM